METVQDSQLRGHGRQVEGARQQTGIQRRIQGEGWHRHHFPSPTCGCKFPPSDFQEGDQRGKSLVRTRKKGKFSKTFKLSSNYFLLSEREKGGRTLSGNEKNRHNPNIDPLWRSKFSCNLISI